MEHGEATHLFSANLAQWSRLDDCLCKAAHDDAICQCTARPPTILKEIETYPTALSEKFRMNLLPSTFSLTTSATCLMLPTRSTTYADLPETFSRSRQGVRRMAAKAGSHPTSSSLKIVAMANEMTLLLISYTRWNGRLIITAKLT